MALLIFIIAVVLFFCILLACKWLNFSILPKGFKLPSPQKFEFPKLKRKQNYSWKEDDEN